MLATQTQSTRTISSTPASGEQWETVRNGLRKLIEPKGPWLQIADSTGFEWNTYQLSIHNLPADLHNFRIIQLADVHARPYWQSGYDQLINRIAADVPDLILFSGDMVESMFNPAPAIPIARKLVSQLKSRLGLFAIRGNHDINVSPASFIGTPVKFIDGQRLLIKPNPQSDARLEILAIPGPLRTNLTNEWITNIPAKVPKIPRIVLSHFPDHIRKLEALHADIFFAGHTHGGQVCIPPGIPIIRHDSLPLKLSKGIHRLTHSWFIVSRGFGFSSIPIRLFCPAEVVEIRLVAG